MKSSVQLQSDSLVTLINEAESSEFLLKISKSHWLQSLDTACFTVKEDSSNMTSFLPPKTARLPSVYEDQKIFLKGSQILETLNGIIRSIVESKDTTSIHFTIEARQKLYSHGFSHRNLKRIRVYHDMLKKLLVQRCILVLKRECVNYIQQNEEFYDECKMLLLRERQKMKTLPVKWHNIFVNSTNINIVNMNMLMEKLNKTSDHWQSLINSYQRIITIFHIGFSIQLHQLFYKANRILTSLQHSVLYLVHHSLNISIQKLCFSDPNSVSSEYLKSVLETCKIFNNFILEKKKIRTSYQCRFNSHSFRFCGIFLVKELSCAYLFDHLSYLEAGIAAEKIVRVLISESQKEMKSIVKNISALMWLSDISTEIEYPGCHNTSDYCSASRSEAENITWEGPCNSWKIKVQPLEGTSNLASVVGSLLQKNQALVLKYLFAVKCLNAAESSKITKNISEGNSGHTIAVRKVWNLTMYGFGDTSGTHLEKVYWTNFWDKTHNIILKLLMEVSYHQYGDILAGTIMIWSETFVAAVIKTLKESSTDDDISTEGQNAIKKIYFDVYAYAAQMSWDKRLSIALAATLSHHCFAVPIVKGEVGTNPGNSLCITLEPLITILTVSIQVTNFTHKIKVLHHLQSLLNFFCNWAIVKKRALLSSWNISSFLLVGYFDTMHAYKSLAHLNLPKHENCTSKRLTVSLTYSFGHIWSNILKLRDELESSLAEVPTEVYKRAYAVGSDFLVSYLKTTCFCRSSASSEVNGEDIVMPKIICIVLNPIYETLKCTPNQTAVIVGALTAIAQAYLDLLQSNKRKLRIQLVKKDVNSLLEWIEQLPLGEDDKTVLKAANFVQELACVVKVIPLSSCKRRMFHINRNEVAPLP